MKKRCKIKEDHQEIISCSRVSGHNYLEDVAHAQLLISFHTLQNSFLCHHVFFLGEETGHKRKKLEIFHIMLDIFARLRKEVANLPPSLQSVKLFWVQQPFLFTSDGKQKAFMTL